MYLQRLATGRKYKFALIEERTREEDFGWVLFYNTEEFVRTGDRAWQLAGNAPLIVDRVSGVLTVTGTAHPIEHYILEYRRNRGPT